MTEAFTPARNFGNHHNNNIPQNVTLDSKSSAAHHIDDIDEEDYVCSICYTKINDSCDDDDGMNIENMYGVLTGCSHTFCFPCISKWRDQKLNEQVTHSCPLCRTYSELVVPSKILYSHSSNKSHDDRKEQAIKEYKNATLCIDSDFIVPFLNANDDDLRDTIFRHVAWSVSQE